MTRWDDYELTRRAASPRVLAYILISLFLLVLFSCSQDQAYSPETQNAEQLRPMPEWQSHTIAVDMTCLNVIVTIDIYVNPAGTDGHTPDGTWCNGPQIRLYRRIGEWGSCVEEANYTPWYSFNSSTLVEPNHVRIVLSRLRSQMPITWQPGDGVGLYWSGSMTLAYEFSPPNCGGMESIHCDLDDAPATCGGGGGFDEQGKVSAHRFACPAFDGSGACVCDQGGLNPQDVMGSFWWAYGIF
jgi:hypothetical protein